MCPKLAVQRESQLRLAFAALARSAPQILIDVGAWFIAILVVQLLVGNFVISNISAIAVFSMLLTVACCNLVLDGSLASTVVDIEYGSFEEVRLLGFVGVSVGLGLAVLVLVAADWFGAPRRSGFLAIPCALLIMLGIRYLRRLILEERKTPRSSGKITLVYGAGELGAMLIRRMHTDKQTEYRPIGLIDDDLQK